MIKEGENPNVVPVSDEPVTDRKPKSPNRRQFLGGVSGVAAAAATLGAIGLEPLVGGKDSVAKASVISYPVDRRADASLRYRIETAKAEDVNVPEQADNGDVKRFTDFSGNYSKALLHDALGVPNLASYQSLIFALTTREFSDFQNIIVGTPGGGPNSKLVSPPAALAFDLEGISSPTASHAPTESAKTIADR